MVPIVICWLVSDALILIFNITISNHQQERGIAEGILAFVLFTIFLITWYVVVFRYERIRKEKVRKQIRIYGKIFLVIYSLVIIRTLYEIIKKFVM